MSKKKKRMKGNPRRILTVSEDPTGKNSRLLRGGCGEVQDIDQSIRQVAADLRETLLRNQALGLAAPQIGHPARIICIQLGKAAVTLINPEIVWYDDSHEVTDTELCLSLPGKERKITRYPGVTVKGWRLDKTYVEEMSFVNTPARCVQHEIDHLDGILITDYWTT